MEPFELEISDVGYQNTDAWWDIFLVLLPASKVSVKKFIIKYTDIPGNKFQVKTRLPQKEQALLQNAFSQTGEAYNGD